MLTQEMNKLSEIELFSFAIKTSITTHYPKLREQKYLDNELSFTITNSETKRN